jgi:hypothetical protein
MTRSDVSIHVGAKETYRVQCFTFPYTIGFVPPWKSIYFFKE